MMWQRLMLSPSLAAALSAQEIWHLDDVFQQIQHGTRVLRLGDINGDGWDDLLEMGLGINPSGGFYRNALYCISGRDGTTLSAYPTPLTLDATGQYILIEQSWIAESLAVLGDMDADGVPDYAVTGNDYLSGGIPLDPVLQVRSSADHHLIWSATVPNGNILLYGLTIAGRMDLDGDGLPDLVAGATRLGLGGAVIAYDHWGTELYRVVNTDLNYVLGVDLAPLGGDLDGDGSDDYLSGSPYGQDQGAVIVMSGRTGAFLRVSHGVQPFDKLSEVTGCGDLDHDGVLDYAGGGDWGNSVVTTFSGATGLSIHSFRPNGAGQAGFGFHVTGGFDVDQDGVNDLVASSSFSWWGHIMSGRDGAILGSHGSPLRFPGDEGAYDMTLLAPPPGERYPLLVYYALRIRQTGVNYRLVATRLRPPDTTTFGTPDAAPQSPTARMGMRVVPGQVRFTLSSAPPSAFAAMALGFSNSSIGGAPLPLPLDPLGLSGIMLLTSTDLAWTGWAGTAGVDAGYVGLDVTTSPAATGLQLFAQWLWIDPADWSRNGSSIAHAFLVP